MNYEKALEYMKYEYNKALGFQDDLLLQKYQDIALILKELSFGTEHFIAALFMNILKETDAVPNEVLRYCNMEVMDAIRLMEDPGNCEKAKKLYLLKNDAIAFPVKMAEQIYKLMNTSNMTNRQITNLLHETEDYYLKCAVGTIFYGPLFMAFVECRKKEKVY